MMEFLLQQEIIESIATWRTIVGVGDNVPCTPTSMRAAIFTRHKRAGIPCLEMPDPVNVPDFTNPTKEVISIKKSPLLRLIVSPHATPEVIRVVEAWWKFKKAEKRLGMVQSEDLIKAVNPEDMRLRPGWNSCGTDTGRFSCSAPNVMQIPQDLRYMFGPPPGRAWVHADKKQLEIRVMACVAADEVLQNIIRSGKDLYEEEARIYFKIPADQKVKKPLRQGAKIGRLARQYGAQEKTCYSQGIAADRTMTISRMRAIIALFDATYWRTVKYWGEETNRVHAAGYSESRLLGRRRVYPRMPDLAEIANWPVQATASDIMNQEFIELDGRLEAEWPSAFIVDQLHDAVDVECDEEDVPRVQSIVSEVMDRNWVVNGVDFNFGIDVKVAYSSKGDTWASV
jgi:DNA polymerase I-like protein with 3'-5' exonuclease and polymerase domains